MGDDANSARDPRSRSAGDESSHELSAGAYVPTISHHQNLHQAPIKQKLREIERETKQVKETYIRIGTIASWEAFST